MAPVSSNIYKLENYLPGSKHRAAIGTPRFTPSGWLVFTIALSYFASKECTYTDASGRQVPAPKASEPMPHRTKDGRAVHDPPPIAPRQPIDVSATSQPRASSSNTRVPSKKRNRSLSDDSDVISERIRVSSEPNGRPGGLEANLVRELINRKRHYPTSQRCS